MIIKTLQEMLAILAIMGLETTRLKYLLVVI